jgi:hypothetical protein
MATQVQTIACVNNAGFVMSFGIEIFDENIGLIRVWEGVDTGNYPIDQTRSIDLASMGIPEGTFVRPVIRPVGANSTNSGDYFVQYIPYSDETATYDVSGILGTYSVHLIGAQ